MKQLISKKIKINFCVSFIRLCRSGCASLMDESLHNKSCFLYVEVSKNVNIVFLIEML